ncbi:MAG: hypothetical protein J6S85_17680 [Methanobrevibacter sp.]|nr:hypothetical protein [Methanobrevibacter sp.]
MASVTEIKELRDKTGCSLKMCKEAFEYAETHEKCTALGYLKAKTYAVYFDSFDRKVREFSNETVG